MKLKVLFLCVHNSARSQMAEMWLKQIAGDLFDVKSAGLEPGALNPLAVEAMREVGIDMSRNQTRGVFDIFKSGELFHYVIAVCDAANAERCPIFPSITKRLNWSFPDPAQVRGSRGAQMEQIRVIRDAIRDRIEQWVAEVRSAHGCAASVIKSLEMNIDSPCRPYSRRRMSQYRRFDHRTAPMRSSHSHNCFGRRAMLLRGIALAAIGILVAGCPARKEIPDASVTGKVIIKGSNTFGEEVAPRLITEYTNEHPSVSFQVESKGSESGFAALLAGDCDIAATSRSASKAEQQQARGKGIELNDQVIGYYGVAVIVSAKNPVTKLTEAQVRDIFSGAIQTWKSVGGPETPIRLCIRDPLSATHLGFRELAMEKKPYAPSAQTFTNYADLVAAVAQDPNTIGYASMSLAERTGVKDLPINGMPPTVTSVNEDRYPYARTLHLYSNKAKETPAVKDFVRFVQSKRGQKILAEIDFVRRFEPRFDHSLD